MTYPRITAMLFLLLLIGSFSWLCINALGLLEPSFSYGANGGRIERVEGKIIAIGAGKDFVLETTSGQRMHFQCSNACTSSFPHIQRHLDEHADTFVYYVDGSRHSLLALNVD
ncbi:MAG TPA: hypothetical protein VEV19_16845 [Ktedonobacteraceae bacterium]|nr:hypothetical protein [Ktedonobacteraceae bacterium]